MLLLPYMAVNTHSSMLGGSKSHGQPNLHIQILFKEKKKKGGGGRGMEADTPQLNKTTTSTNTL